LTDTIAAISTAPGVAGVAILRLSGPDAFRVADALLPHASRRVSERAANTFFLAPLHHPKTRALLDRALLLIFHAPRSYTGENTVELQCHGGSQSPAKILDALLDAGARLARPGEFTLRAFLNGRLDLTQAEAVLDLLNARTERAAAAAQEQLSGRLRSDFDALYETLLDTAATLEHHLDFSDDELPPAHLARTAREMGEKLNHAACGISTLLATFRQGLLLRDGATVVIAGPPNAGKSSLLNALLGHDRAIVTPIPGTTRDTLEETFNLRGIPVRLVDTAGLRDTTCPVETLGIERTRDALQSADAILYLLDTTQPPAASDLATLRQLPPDRTLLLLNKTDLLESPASNVESRKSKVESPKSEVRSRLPTYKISALNPSTLTPVLDALHTLLLHAAPSSDTAGACISARHRQILVATLGHCHEALPLLADPGAGWVVAASLIRQAAEEVATLTGRRYSDDLLDRVFSRFCVGK